MLKAASPLLVVSDLGHAYYSQPVLAGVSFQVSPGELVTLIGRNGAGKSTLLRCLAGWMRPTDGEIHILGLPVPAAERAARRQVILVPDAPAFYDELTAWEHLQFGAQARRLGGWEGAGAALLRRFGLARFRDAYPFTLSRGVRYKLALCLALLHRPPLLLLDEPLASLDPVSADDLWAELLRCRDAGMGILLSSHQLPPVPGPDRYLVLEEGKLVARGTPGELARSLSIEGPLSLSSLLRAAIEPGPEEDGNG